MNVDWIAFLGVSVLAVLLAVIALTPHLLGRYGKEALLATSAFLGVNAILRLLLILEVITDTGGRQAAGLAAVAFAAIIVQVIVVAVSERRRGLWTE